MWFFHTHAGKGTVGIALCALLLAWPPALSWLAAAVILYWSIHHLRAAFQATEESTLAAAERPPMPDRVGGLATTRANDIQRRDRPVQEMGRYREK